MAESARGGSVAAPRLRSSVHVENDLREKVRDGMLAAGTRLASRRELAQQYGVALGTVERAIAGLLDEGILIADGGRGTFVARSEAMTATPSLVSGGATVMRPAALPSVHTVGIVAPLYAGPLEHHLNLHDMWMRSLVQPVEQALSLYEISTRFFNRVVRESATAPPIVLSLEDGVSSALAAEVDALILTAIGVAPSIVDDCLSSLDTTRTPVVCVTDGELRQPIPHIFHDDRSGGYQAAEHLIRTGCHELIFFAPFMTFWVEQRLEGVRAAMRNAGLSPQALRVWPENPPPWANEAKPEAIGRQASRGLFSDDGHLAAAERSQSIGVIAVNDGVAFGLMHAAEEAGKKPGVDFALLGFDDHPNSRMVGLTSLRLPFDAMGKEAARLLLSSLRKEQVSTQVRLGWNLIPRESTRSTRLTVSGDR